MHIAFTEDLFYVVGSGLQKRDYIIGQYGKQSKPMIMVRNNNCEENLMKGLIEYHNDGSTVEKHFRNDKIRYLLWQYTQENNKPVNQNLFRNMHNNIEYENILEDLDKYHIVEDYEMSATGDVDLFSRVIRLNPHFKYKYALIIKHEHNHIIDEQQGYLTPENIIEDDARRYVTDNPGFKNCIEDYLCERLK